MKQLFCRIYYPTLTWWQSSILRTSIFQVRRPRKEEEEMRDEEGLRKLGASSSDGVPFLQNCISWTKCVWLIMVNAVAELSGTKGFYNL